MSESRNEGDAAFPPRRSRQPMDPLAGAFRLHIERSGLIRSGERVLVALSGGIDSVVLLHLLRFHSASLRLGLTAAHFDHRMRSSSLADADWVRGLCKVWNVPLELGVSDGPLRSEADARRSRYAFLELAAARAGADRIATAHHADDQAETVLFRVLRGTGLAALSGIPEQRGALVRPLLPFTRMQIRTYATRARLQYQEDPTNRDLRYARNRIRHVVLPAMERAAPGFTRALLRLSEEAKADEDAWREITRRALNDVVRAQDEHSVQLARSVLLGYHRQIILRVIREAAGRLGNRPGRAGTQAALTFITSGGTGAVELAGGLRLERHFERLLIRRAAEPPVDQPLVIPEPGNGSGVAVIGGRTFAVQWSAGPEIDSAAAASFPVTALRFPLELRAWRPGDRIRLAAGTRKLKKLFLERRVPRHARRTLPVLAEPGGAILWVRGLARAVRAEPAPGTAVFHFRVLDEHGG